MSENIRKSSFLFVANFITLRWNLRGVSFCKTPDLSEMLKMEMVPLKSSFIYFVLFCFVFFHFYLLVFGLVG